MTWIYRRILNKVWMHIHSTIIHRCVIIRIRSEPWSNRPTKWIWRKSIITLLNMRSRLLTMLRRWICIFSLIWSLLLFLSCSFLLILGQELLETQPFLFVVSEIFSRALRMTGQTGLQTGLCRPGTFLLLVPPRELNLSMKLQGTSSLEFLWFVSEILALVHQWSHFFPLLIRPN